VAGDGRLAQGGGQCPARGNRAEPADEEPGVEGIAGSGRVGSRQRLRGHLEAQALGPVPGHHGGPFRPSLHDRARRELEQTLDAVAAEQRLRLGRGREQEVRRRFADQLPRDAPATTQERADRGKVDADEGARGPPKLDCAAAGLGSQCTGTLAGAALSLQFDAAAATACLDALHARQAGADFCGGLATVHPSWNNDSAVLPECAGVFKPYGGVVGSVGLGDACSDDTDCEAGPTGRSACVFDIFRAGASGGLNEICVGISGTPGDGPCIGTAGVMSGFSGVADPPAAGVFCDRGQGLICSDTTHLCVAAPGLGDPCTGSIECESAATYCDFNIAACATRHAAGQPCNDAFGVCVDGTYCNRTTSQCTAQGGQGAACSTTFQLPSDCKAGYCGSDGICPSPLTPLCF